MDNGWEFRGSARWPRSLGKVIRLGLVLKVEILFIPEGEPCYNGSVENLNGMLDRRFVKTQRFEDLDQIRQELAKLNEAILSQHIHEHLGLKTPKQYRQGKALRVESCKVIPVKVSQSRAGFTANSLILASHRRVNRTSKLIEEPLSSHRRGTSTILRINRPKSDSSSFSVPRPPQTGMTFRDNGGGMTL